MSIMNGCVLWKLCESFHTLEESSYQYIKISDQFSSDSVGEFPPWQFWFVPINGIEGFDRFSVIKMWKSYSVMTCWLQHFLWPQKSFKIIIPECLSITPSPLVLFQVLILGHMIYTMGGTICHLINLFV